MPDAPPNLRRRILSLPVEAVVAIYVVLDAVISPLFRPVMRWLSRLRLVQRLETAMAGLPPYVVLVLLVVPFALAELAKAYAVLLMAEEHFRIGATLFVGAYIVSILVCERTFQAGKGQLMTIGWFKAGFDWAMAKKSRVLAWFQRTRIWRLSEQVRRKSRLMVQKLRSAFGAKPKGTFERQ